MGTKRTCHDRAGAMLQHLGRVAHAPHLAEKSSKFKSHWQFAVPFCSAAQEMSASCTRQIKAGQDGDTSGPSA